MEFARSPFCYASIFRRTRANFCLLNRDTPDSEEERNAHRESTIPCAFPRFLSEFAGGPLTTKQRTSPGKL